MFKKLFCDHMYEWFHTEQYVPILTISRFDKWNFVCKKCGKTSSLYERDVIEAAHHYRKLVDKQVALGENISVYEGTSFIIGKFKYEGKLAHYMANHYPKYYQEKPCSSYY